MTIRVLVVDDHPLFRYGLRTALTDVENLTVVGEAVDGADAVRAALELGAHVVLMDLHLVVTQVVNELVNNAGITYFHRLAGKTQRLRQSSTRANFVAREIFGASGCRNRSRPSTTSSTPRCRPHAAGERPWWERASRWLLNSRLIARNTESVVDAFEVVVEKVMGAAVAHGRPRAQGVRGAT